ncbi:hypothetical protein FVR03_10790 [Pontibacter qinzhouensis]|uniref:Uncharacterized protein n=1 Tax=Pontibacter qinzhouensis TaxID=2603253 RepID=A0A5C8KA30_9BACT|nr:hypothetical protein [Pontibacter qinzhouensis]TXK46366.1 hypothetical protein FVR03_10790 [Pontibacter qinzhouensis]
MAIRDEDKKSTPDKPKNVHDDFNKRVTIGNEPDPSAKRNVGRGGDLERDDQKDKLENMHIGGNEATGYGANDPKSKESYAQGPGFEFEGSDTAMDDSVNGIRNSDQPFEGEASANDQEGDPTRV